MIQMAFFYSYPHAPAARPADTSREARDVIEPSVAEYRQKCLAVLAGGDYTADEIAARLNRSILYVRPRCAELNKLGLIEDSGIRRANSSGRKAIVWRKKA